MRNRRNKYNIWNGAAGRKLTASHAASAPKGAIMGSEIEVVITPEAIDHRVDRLGRGYAWTRGKLTYRQKTLFRTVMVQGDAYKLMCDLLNIGTSLKISGRRANVIDNQTGRIGGEIFRALEVLKVYDAVGREIDGSTGRVIDGHERKGHYRRQHYGPGNQLVKIVFIPDTKVNGGSASARQAA